MARTFLNKTNIPLNQGYIPNLQVKLYGQWSETLRTLHKLDPAIKEASAIAQMKICRQIAKRVKEHLVNQDLSWAPLNREYAKRKEAAGADDRTLISFSGYYNAINVWRVSNQHFVFIGVKKGMYTRSLSGKKSHLEIAQIAAAHEFSSGKRFPRRPLWNPTIAEMGGAAGLKELFIKHFTGTLRSRGIPIKRFQNIF